MASLSGQNVDIDEIADHFSDLSLAIHFYFSSASPDFPVRFAGYSNDEIELERLTRIQELEFNYTLSLLSALEAAFWVDYHRRCDSRLKDNISRAFRGMNRRKTRNVSFSEDILKTWKNSELAPIALLNSVNEAFGLRNWLAHGRYWVPKFGKKYDFLSIYTMAKNVLVALDLKGI